MPYSLEAPEDFFRQYLALRPGHQERVKRALERLLADPHQRTPGVKRLRGAQAGLYQFMVSQSDGTRLLFSVDDEARVLRVRSLGKHPTWRRSRDRDRPTNY